MQIRLLGPVEIEGAGHPVALAGARSHGTARRHVTLSTRAVRQGAVRWSPAAGRRMAGRRQRLTR
jgi:hypothetical protein